MSVVVDEPRFPEAHVAADRAAVDAQRRFLRSTRLQLVLLVLAGTFGILSWRAGRLDLAALAGGVAFAAAAFLRFRLLRRSLHRTWYEGRAAAESIKTISWRYAVGGDPFPSNEPQARAHFEEQVEDVLEGLLTLPRRAGDASPTEWMEAARAAPWTRRRDTYLRHRILDQIDWYSTKSVWNRDRARWWGTAIFVLQGAGAAGAFLKGFGVIGLDVFGPATALVGSAAAWLEARQHGSLASAYAVAADELRRIAAIMHSEIAETRWSRFVSEAEAAISREHTTWKASSSYRRPVSLA